MAYLGAQLRLVEAKASDTAQFTKNQKSNYSGLTKQKGTGIQYEKLGQQHKVVGEKGGTTFPAGFPIPAKRPLAQFPFGLSGCGAAGAGAWPVGGCVLLPSAAFRWASS